jgi:hypothetical protein
LLKDRHQLGDNEMALLRPCDMEGIERQEIRRVARSKDNHLVRTPRRHESFCGSSKVSMRVKHCDTFGTFKVASQEVHQQIRLARARSSNCEDVVSPIASFYAKGAFVIAKHDLGERCNGFCHRGLS